MPRASRKGSGPAAEREPPDEQAAMEIAIHYLGTRPRTRWELQRRLQRAKAEPMVAAAVLERLTELGYADDLAFARWWLEQRDRHGPRGRRLIEAELRQHGVPRDVLERLRGEEPTAVDGPDTEPLDEIERAHRALVRHLRDRPLPAEPRALQRVAAFLVRRGFDPETARGAIRAVGRGDETPD